MQSSSARALTGGVGVSGHISVLLLQSLTERIETGGSACSYIPVAAVCGAHVLIRI